MSHKFYYYLCIAADGKFSNALCRGKRYSNVNYTFEVPLRRKSRQIIHRHRRLHNYIARVHFLPCVAGCLAPACRFNSRRLLYQSLIRHSDLYMDAGRLQPRNTDE